MSAILIDGKAHAKNVRRELKSRIKKMAENGIVPGLAVVLVGDDPASQVYVKTKIRACEKVGIHSELHSLPASTSLEHLKATLETLNQNPSINGILVQLPLPPHLDPKIVLPLIHPDKDVDGLHPVNIGRFHSGIPGFIPCTPLGIMRMLHDEQVPIAGKNAVVIGRSAIVGRPMSWLLLRSHATVTTCHRHTQNLADIVKTADILVSAVGSPHLVRGDWIKPGAVVIDVGINRLEDGSLTGDIAPEAREVASKITPVPGGVGPMTVAMLLSNTVFATQIFQNKG